MFDPDQLRAIERECAFRYPAGFLAIASELARLTASPGFSEAFPGGRLAAAGDIASAWAGCLPDELVPFMFEAQTDCTDYDCFHRREENRESKVVVFTDHSVVHDWPDFETFLSWARRVCRTEAPA